MLPIFGGAVQMHYGQNEDGIVFYAINYAIRETPDQCSTEVARECGPGIGKAADGFYRRPDFGGKIESKPSAATFIIIDS